VRPPGAVLDTARADRAPSTFEWGQGFVGQPPGEGNGRDGPAEKKYRGLIHGGSGAFGNAATRIEAFIAGRGTYAYGSYADIDGLFREQASEVDPKPIWLNAGTNGVGPRVEESGTGLVAGYIFSAPYEDVKLRGK
jgi:peptide/nickel transport system substrate-binding protein